jgi:glycosyltransferase 2 family protein
VSTPSPAIGAPRPAHLSLFGIVAALVGLVLLVLTIRQVGWGAVVQGISSVGVWFLVVVALGGLRFAARARGWQACTEGTVGSRESGVGSRESGVGVPERPSDFDFPHAFGATLAADALGNLTPLGLLASEPAKVLLVRRRLSTVAGISSVAADNVFYTLSVLVMIVAGMLVFVRRTTVPSELTLAADVVIGIAVVAMLAGVWIARQQPALLSWLAARVFRWTGRGHTSSDRLAEIEQRFYGLLQWPAGRLLRIAGWHMLFHVAAVAESFLVLRLLPGGAHASLVDAFLLETTGRFITVAFKFVPYRLGVDEAGTALVARALAFDPTIGVSIALVRRLRILVWNGIGLALLARHRG